jgi:hypothetical protein
MKTIEIEKVASVLRPYLFAINFGTDDYGRGMVEGGRRVAFSLVNEICGDDIELASTILGKAWAQLKENAKAQNKKK